MAKDKFEPLTDYERSLIQRLFSQSGEWPPEFMAGITSKLEVNPPKLIVSDIPSLKGEEWRDVGATGQPSFANSWVNVDAVRVASFYKDVLGIVHLKGVISTGTIGTTAFTLPEGYRPAHTHEFAVNSNSAHGVVQVTNNGSVNPVVGNNAFVFLDGVSFRAA